MWGNAVLILSVVFLIVRKIAIITIITVFGILVVVRQFMIVKILWI
jgi:hypothetical protein